MPVPLQPVRLAHFDQLRVHQAPLQRLNVKHGNFEFHNRRVRGAVISGRRLRFIRLRRLHIHLLLSLLPLGNSNLSLWREQTRRRGALPAKRNLADRRFQTRPPLLLLLAREHAHHGIPVRQGWSCRRSIACISLYRFPLTRAIGRRARGQRRDRSDTA